MTNRDRDSAARLLGELADRLDGAPARVSERAQQHIIDAKIEAVADHFKSVYQVAGLENVCHDEATALRSLIESYLVPRSSKARGRK